MPAPPAPLPGLCKEGHCFPAGSLATPRNKGMDALPKTERQPMSRTESQQPSWAQTGSLPWEATPTSPLREVLWDNDPAPESPSSSLLSKCYPTAESIIQVTSTLPTVPLSPKAEPVLLNSAKPRTRGNYFRQEETDATLSSQKEHAHTHSDMRQRAPDRPCVCAHRVHA